jgi:hypothetical protein
MQLITSGYDLSSPGTFITIQSEARFASHRLGLSPAICRGSSGCSPDQQIGAGIGTISQLVLLHQNGREPHSIEQNPSCCAALKENVTPLPGQS